MQSGERQIRQPASSRDAARGEAVDRLDSGSQMPFPADKVRLLEAWRDISERIVSYNAQQGGGPLQNGVYRYTRVMLKELGLDKQGWEALPVQTGSALDMVGGDILLINNRTGRIELLDASNRRLNQRTGEFLSSAESEKTNVPALRERGVVDALPSYFDRTTGHLELDQSTPELTEAVKAFRVDFAQQLKSLTDPTTAGHFNLRHFPLPSPTVTKDQDAKTREIRAVVDWSQAEAQDAVRRGERGLSYEFKEFARNIESGALSFASRVSSNGLNETVNRLAERIILEDAAKAIYHNPNAQKFSESMLKHRQSTADGTTVQVKPDGSLVITMRPQSGPGGAPEIYSGGSVLSAFDAAAKKLAVASASPEQYSEIAKELPGHYKKMYEAGKLDMGKVLQIVARFRNQFAAGGVGEERALVGHLVHKLAERDSADLRRLATGETRGSEPKVAGDKAPVTQNRVGSDNRYGGREAPTLKEIGRNENGVDPRYADHLSPQELARLDQLKAEFTRRGNLSPAERETLSALDRARRELSTPGEKSPQSNARLVAIRRAISGEFATRTVGPAMVGIVLLNLYRSRPEDDDVRPTFGVGW